MSKVFLVMAIALFSACGGAEGETSKEDTQPTSSSSTHSTLQTTIPSLQYEDLLQLFQKDNDTLYIVNFWATWCAPCVAELPHFLEVNRSMSKTHPIKMYLISLDMPSKIENVQDFIQTENVDAEVILLDDAKRMNTWIPAIDDSWSGAIPATLFYKNSKKLFFKEGILSKEELINLINENIK